MSASCPTTKVAAPWRRSVQAKSFSAESAEYVPSFSTESAAYVPSWKVSSEAAMPESFSAASAEYVPPSLRLKCIDSDECKPSVRCISSLTLSTSEGSSSGGDAADDTSSTASVSSVSRSPSPAPPAPCAPPVVQESVCSPMSLHSLMQWRHAAPRVSSEGEKLPFAAKPEAGSAEEAAALAAAEAAASPVQAQIAKTPPPSPKKVPEAAPSTPPAAQDNNLWRDISPVKKLEVSEGSWAAKQRARRSTGTVSDTTIMTDEEVVRKMKLILNKLTIEKFDSLSSQLINVGIQNAVQLELLIREIFEKATTQHHFIDMYADLCTLLNDNGVINDPTVKFKKILLSCCQASFEMNLTPPSNIAEMGDADRIIAENLYKTRMLGNIRFVGALLNRKMLASKVMLSIMEELMQDPTPEALESLAALLTVVGPTFDMPQWPYIATLNAIFKQVEKLVKKSSVPSRIRFLLKDVVELRNAGWHDKRPRKMEGPSKLDQVAAKVAMENGEKSPTKAMNISCDWEVVGAAR